METQRIALFGATSKVGQRILNEALSRGHKVTAIVRDPKKIPTTHTNLKVIPSNIFNRAEVTEKLKGHDIAICAYETTPAPQDHVSITRTLIDGVRDSDIRHFILFGHPGSEEREPEVTTPKTPEGWKAIAKAQREAIEALKKERSFHWGYAYYPEIEEPLGKNGKPSLSNQITLLTNEGDQKFSVDKCAEKVLDEAEHLMEEHTEL